MKSEPKAEEWTGAPQMDTGAPMPSISVRDDGLYVAYALPGLGEGYAIVRFTGVLQHTFGYPNDEALGEHPLYKAGLQFYAFNEVKDSPYVRELATRNARVFPGSEQRYVKWRHWIVTFHDDTLEVIGEGLEFLGVTSADSASAAIDAHVVQQRTAGDVRNARA
jgi:hypothetical protein